MGDCVIGNPLGRAAKYDFLPRTTKEYIANFPSEMYRNMSRIDSSSPQITLLPCTASTSGTDFLQPYPLGDLK